MAIDQIEGLTPGAGEKLKAIGIEKLMDLRMMGKTPEGRADIAAKTGLSLDDVNRWVDQAVAIRKAEQAAEADAAPAIAAPAAATAAPAAEQPSAAQAASLQAVAPDAAPAEARAPMQAAAAPSVQPVATVAPEQKTETPTVSQPAAAATPEPPATPLVPTAASAAASAQPAAQAAPAGAAAAAPTAAAGPLPSDARMASNRRDTPIAPAASTKLFGKFRDIPRPTNRLSTLLQKARARAEQPPQPTQGGPGVGRTLGDIVGMLLGAFGSLPAAGAGSQATSQPASGGTPVQINWPSIGQIKGVDSSLAQKLQNAGIMNAGDLLRRSQTPQARKELASKMGVPDSVVLLWLGDVISTQAPQVAKARGIDVTEIVDLEELDTLIEETEIYDEEFEEVESYEIEEIVYEEEEEEEEEDEEEEEEEEEEDE